MEAQVFGPGLFLKKTEYPLNKLTGSGSVVNYTYGDSEWKDLLTSYNGKSISYDDIGNPWRYYSGHMLEWTGRELDRIQDKYGQYTIYKYDADGIRTEKEIYGKETHKYLLEGNRIIREEILDKNGVRKHLLWYNYDSNGQLTGVEYDGVKYLYKVNQMGDVLGLYDGTGKLVVKYRYDAWGKVKEIENNNGQTITNAESIGMRNPFRYRSYYYDTDTGWYYLNARYYDPETGRFLNADGYASTGQGIVGHNMFAYCNNNPVMNVDYTGGCPVGFVGPCPGPGRCKSWSGFFGAGYTSNIRKNQEESLTPEILPIKVKQGRTQNTVISSKGDSSRPVSVRATHISNKPERSSVGIIINISKFSLDVSLGLDDIGMTGAWTDGDISNSFGISASLLDFGVKGEYATTVSKWDVISETNYTNVTVDGWLIVTAAALLSTGQYYPAPQVTYN